jgi:formate dehydrogenase subunit beta
LFISVADKTQAAFDYTPGKDPEQLPPLAEFNENEFEEVVGIID